MRRDDVITKLKGTEGSLRSLGVSALYLFGSHARDEAGDASDIDVFVDPRPDAAFGFIPFMEACQTIEDAVGHPVDYGTREGLHPGLRTSIEQEAVKIF